MVPAEALVTFPVTSNGELLKYNWLVREVGIFTPFAVNPLIAAVIAISYPCFPDTTVLVLTLEKFINLITLKRKYYGNHNNLFRQRRK